MLDSTKLLHLKVTSHVSAGVRVRLALLFSGEGTRTIAFSLASARTFFVNTVCSAAILFASIRAMATDATSLPSLDGWFSACR